MRTLIIPFLLAGLTAFGAASVDWFSYLGKSFEDKDVMAQFGQYGEYSSYIYRSDDETQMNWGPKGISITTNDAAELQKIYFFTNGYKLDDVTFRQCNKPLPFGITFDMTPEQVIEKLGTPSVDKGSYFRNIHYKTNYEYKFLFKEKSLQYMQIGLVK